MKEGCLKDLLAGVGCVTVLVLLAAVLWLARAQVGGLIRSLGRDGPTDRAVSVGTPATEALRSARRKEQALGRRGGPAYVVLTADEVASVLGAVLDSTAPGVVDSLRVLLADERVTVEGIIATDVLSRDLAGPLGDLLDSRQPVRLGGPLTVPEPGTVVWACDEFVLRAFPFPRAAIPRLVNRLTGDTSGVFRLPMPPTVGDVRVRADGITFYRRAE